MTWEEAPLSRYLVSTGLVMDRVSAWRRRSRGTKLVMYRVPSCLSLSLNLILSLSLSLSPSLSLSLTRCGPSGAAHEAKAFGATVLNADAGGIVTFPARRGVREGGKTGNQRTAAKRAGDWPPGSSVLLPCLP